MITDTQWNAIFKWRDEFARDLIGYELYDCQKEFSNKVIKSVILNAGETFTAQWTRQFGKTTITARVTIPFLIISYFSIVEKFGISHTDFFNIGFFAPQEQQVKTDFDIVKDTMLLLQTKGYNLDIGEKSSNTIKINRGKYPPRMIYAFTASPTSHPESKTLNLIILEESQDLVDQQVDKAIMPMGASCVCKDTILYNGEGVPTKVQDLPKEVLGTDDNYNVVVNKTSNKSKVKKQCFRLTTNSGRKLECSYDHPIMIKNRNTRKTQFVNTSDIKIGTQIAIADKIGLFGNRKMFDPRLIGMLIGDGSYCKKSMVRYCSCDYELLDYVKDKYEFKSYNTYLTKKDKVFEDGTIKGLCGELRNIGIYGQTGKDKRLPKDIFNYCKKDISELLGGLFDTDGYITLEENRRSRIGFDSSNREIVDEISLLLEKFGIHSRIYKSINKSKIVKKVCSIWRLVISEKKSIERFYNNIRFLINYKQLKLKKVINILQSYKYKRQKNMMNVYFERLISKEDIGEQYVYNMTANKTNTYLANGIITHNTNATSVWIGVAGYQRCKFQKFNEVLDSDHKVIVDYKQALQEQADKYEKTGNPFYLNYAKYIDKQKREIGETSDEFITQYSMRWILERGQFIVYDDLMKLEEDYEVKEEYFDTFDCYAGIDWGKVHDGTVMTIVDSDCRIIGWFTWQGDDYSSQIEEIVHILHTRYRGCRKIWCDATANQDMAVDALKARISQERKMNVAVEGYKFSASSKDYMWKNLDRLMRDKVMNGQVIERSKLRFPKNFDPIIKEKFVKQMLDLQKDIRNGIWRCQHPEGPHYHDDYPDSCALACLAFKINKTKKYKPGIA